MNRAIRRVTALFVIIFVALGLNLTYLQIIEAERIANHPKNTRDILDELTIPRGKIITADGVVLADNKKVGNKYFRVYPKGEGTAHIVGFNSTRYGRSGLEQTFNQYLLGQREVASFKDYIDQVMKKGKPGNDLILTLNYELQEEACKALGKEQGAIVALKPETGEVLALAVNPTYDPNRVEEDWKELASSPSSPLLNRATQGRYPPGSSFKIITAAAAIQEEIASPDKVYEGPKELKVYGGRVTNYADQGYGQMTFKKAFAKSCNTIFAQVGLELGGKTLVDYAELFGLNEEIPFDLPLKPSEISPAGSMDDLELAWTAVGQGRTLVTPFEMALVASAIGSEGIMMRPYLVKESRNYKGEIVKQFGGKSLGRVVSKDTAKTVTDFMVEVVEEGTGVRAKSTQIPIAGKTGTAEHSKKKDTHAWFVCFAPAHNSEVAVAVLIENGGLGGRVAAPIAKKIIEKAVASDSVGESKEKE